MAKTHIHTGPLSLLPPTASPGLHFLASFLPTIDALDSPSSALLAHLSPDATFVINRNTSIAAESVAAMLQKRGSVLERFGHEVHRVWDVVDGEGDGGEEGGGEGEGGEGKAVGRTVMYEATSTTVFKDDPEAVEVKVEEFNIIKLVPGEDGRLKAVELRSYMDSSPVERRMKVVLDMKTQTG